MKLNSAAQKVVHMSCFKVARRLYPGRHSIYKTTQNGMVFFFFFEGVGSLTSYSKVILSVYPCTCSSLLSVGITGVT